jgi:hypothetical protein
MSKTCSWCGRKYEGKDAYHFMAGKNICSDKCVSEIVENNKRKSESKNSSSGDGGGGCAGMLILIVSVSALLFMGIYNAIIA